MKIQWFSAALLCFALGSSAASANTGTLLPLDQYQAGTESTNHTIVPNGNFEAVTGSTPDGWTAVGLPGEAPIVGTPSGPHASTAVNGTKAVQWDGRNTTAEPNKFTQTIALTPNTDYVISGYAWNFAAGFPDDILLGELRDSGGGFIQNFALQNNGGGIDGSRGVFAYNTFNSGANTSAVIEVNFNQNGFNGDTTLGGRPAIAAQIDNISVTPASSFQAPVAPEPATLASLIGVAAIAIRRSRRA